MLKATSFHLLICSQFTLLWELRFEVQIFFFVHVSFLPPLYLPCYQTSSFYCYLVLKEDGQLCRLKAVNV